MLLLMKKKSRQPLVPLLIIPAEERAKVEAEKLEDLKLKPRSRKAVEKVSLKFLLRKSH